MNPAAAALPLPNHGRNAYQDRHELMRTIGDIAYSRTSFFRYYHTPEQVNAFLRNEGRMLGIIERSTETANIMSAAAILMSPNINNIIAGSSLPAGFWDSVPVFLTNAQLTAALQPFTPAAENTDLCCICQENLNVRPACELAQCHHHLHRTCAEQWFAMSTRCPVCRASAA
jgi:hypothetical protein